MFDGSIGAGSVFMPHGGKYQMTETQAMVAKVPVQNGTTDSVSMMSYGFDPYLSSWSPYHGAVYAVTESVAKIVAAGGDYSKIRFTFQEYFRRMTEDPKRWSQPLLHCSEPMRHRSDLVFRQSEVRTVCPEHSRILMFLRRWYLLQSIWHWSRISSHLN